VGIEGISQSKCSRMKLEVVSESFLNVHDM
jgi:hypothetical protein